MRLVINLVLVCVFIVSCSQDSITDQEYLNRANVHYGKGEINASVIELKNALKVNAKNTDARLLLGRIYVEQLNGVNAEKELMRAREYGLASDESGLLLGKAFLLQGKLDEAKNILTGITSPESKIEKTALLLEMSIAAGDSVSAEKLNNELDASQHSSVSAYLAVARYRATNKKIEQAQSAVQKALAVDPESTDAYLLQGNLHQLQGENEQAQKAYLKVVELEPVHGFSVRAFQARVALAFSFLRENKLDESRKHIDVLYALNNNHFIPNYLNGAIAFQQQQYEKAHEYLQVAYSSNEKYAPTLFLMGAVNYALGNYNQAESFLSQYLSRYPANTAAARLLSATYIRLGDASKAMNVINTSLETNPDDTELLSMAGQVAATQGNIKLAESYINKSMAGSDDKAKGHMQLATAYIAGGDLDSAIDELKDLGTTSDIDEFSRVRALVYAYLKKNNPQQALSEARQYANKHSSETRAFNLLAAVYLSLRDLNAAQTHFKNALKLDANDNMALINLSRIAIVQNNTVEAKNWLGRILAANKKHVGAMVMMARVESQEGNDQEAVKWLRKAADTSPKAVPPRLLLANFYFKNRDYKNAHKYIDDALKIQPSNSLATGLLVDVLLREKNIPKALQVAKELVSKAPKQAAAHAKLGQVYTLSKEFEDAKKAYAEAIKITPGFIPALIAMAKIELQLGNNDKALAIAGDLQRQYPKSTTGLELQGDIYTELKKYSQASGSYGKALEVRKTSLLVNKLAMAQHKSGSKWEEINRTLSVWLAEHPDDAATLLRLAVIARARGKVDIAISAYREILKLQPDNFVILNDLAYVLYEQEKSQEAVSFAKRAYNLKPENIAGQDTYGWILVQEGKLAEGMDLLEKAYKGLNPAHPDIAYHYAFALDKAGKAKDAKNILDNALKNNNNFESKVKAEQLLEKL